MAHTAQLNILILLNRVPYPLNDGGAIGAYNFVKGYAEAGCNVTMLAMNTTRHFVPHNIVQQELGKYGTIHTVMIDNRIKPIPALLNLFTSRSYNMGRFVSEDYDRALITLLQQHEFDVVHVDGLPPASYIPTIRHYSKAVVSMRAHNVEHVIWQRLAENEKNPLKQWYMKVQAPRLKQFELKALQACDVVLAISADDEATIKNNVPTANTVVVPAGMEIEETVVNTNYNPLDLFFIGSFDWMPTTQGFNWFMADVWPVLVNKCKGVQLAIAGKKMPDSVKAMKSANLHPAGEVPDARAFILQHGIMVVPVVSGSGIRIKILEGIALGKTIIATTLAAEGMGLTDGENILIADTAEEFVQKIQYCIANEGYCRQIGQNAHAFAVTNYRNQSIIAKLLACYRALK